MRRISALFTALALLSSAGCQSSPPAAAATPSPSPTLIPTASLVALTATPTQSLTPVPSSTPALSPVSSPLDSVSLADLGKIVSNPFDLPAPGHDDGHHGTDFAYYRWGERVGMLGLPVHSVFDGQVAAVVVNRPPYGNMVILETNWSALPPGVRGLLGSPLPPTPRPGDIRLTCPGFFSFPAGAAGQPSLYLLYAHMQEPPQLHVGDPIASGAQIGKVGTTGASVNPHLHLETRVGPPGATFPGLSHYIATATDAEMEGYCTWRVSGVFAMLDPLVVLHAAQTN